MPSSVQLFAPEVFPTAHSELRAYTIAAFRIAQQSDQLSLIPMSSQVLEFLLKERALGYWVKQGRLIQENHQYRLTPQGLVLCQSALAGELATHNTAAVQVEYWVSEFNSNQQLPRSKSFQI